MAMSHDDFIDEYLEKVESDSEKKPEPLPRFNHWKYQTERRLQTAENILFPRVVKEPSSLCEVCSVDTFEIDEYYMVHFDIWQTVVPKKMQGDLLCIGCLEGFLGRQLVSEDFLEAPVNYMPGRSERLIDRMGDWFTALDGPYQTADELHAAANEIGKRIDGSRPRKRVKF